MPDSIDYLDFFPEDPEAISALYNLSQLDIEYEEAHFQQKRKHRIRVALASIATSMALAGSGLGYISYNDAREYYHSTISQIPETACMSFMGLIGGALIAGGVLEFYGRRHPLRQLDKIY